MHLRFHLFSMLLTTVVQMGAGQTGILVADVAKQSFASCCCGQFSEIFFPNLDFETGPLPGPGTFFTYGTGSNFGGWTVTQGTIDHCDALVGNLGLGNPNGASYFIDLHGSPGLGGISYDLFGLTPGNQYRIEFWTAQNGSGFSSTGYLKIAAGAWLNVNWTVSVSGSVSWRKETYEFTAQASSATMEFSSSGPMIFAGTLVDDIKIFECPGDVEPPEVLNLPTDLTVECENQVGTPARLLTSDNCDANPSVVLKETKETIDPCTKKVTREWTIKDDCNNETVIQQIIEVFDQSPPQLIKQSTPLTVYCHQDVLKPFQDWLRKNGNATATDACGPVTWRASYDRLPGQHCDSFIVEFIASDPCGNETSSYGLFKISDTTRLKFTVPAKNWDVGNAPQPRDSLRVWLEQFAFSKSNMGCDSVMMYHNFKGDSTQNPLFVWFYVKDPCGQVDSSLAKFSYQSILQCCCGQPTELFFSNLDFESPPIAPPGGWIDYNAGENYGGWNITSGTISIHDPAHLNLGAGNPNGSTQHMDLHGSSQGAAAYTLTGLTAGNRYTISFWYAIHSFGANVSANLRVNGGSLLNASWNASNPGNVNWLQAMYEFIADGPVATMEFMGTGATPCCGMLIDDIQIFECPNDEEAPEVLTVLDDLLAECMKDVPKPPMPLLVSDNCDANPKINFKENTATIDACTKIITRTWEVKDACGNVHTEDQTIEIKDQNPPVFQKNPEDKTAYCGQDINKELNNWINKNGNATATDACGNVSWRTSIDHSPDKKCDTILVEFFAIDHCGNESSQFANFYIQDTSGPSFITKPRDQQFTCIPNPKDSLRVWLDSFGYAKVSSDCDTVILSYHFNGDSSSSRISVTFFAKDRCGNADSSTAIFSYRTASDTFRISQSSCSFTQNETDTTRYSSNGCDSIVILQKISLKTDSINLNLYTCDSLQSGNDTLKLTNVSGCDSLVFRHFTLKQKPITRIDLYDCKYNQYASDTTIVQSTFCDSMIITQYFPLNKDSTFIDQFTCDSSKAGVVVFRLTNGAGCDSLVHVRTLLSSIQTTIRDTFECGLNMPYVDTLLFHTNSCDSLVVTQHHSRPIDTIHIAGTTCEVFKAGIFQYRYTNRFGCDSIVLEQIRLLKSDTTSIVGSTCFLSQSGVYRDTFTNQFGCDSIVIENIAFIPADTITEISYTCDPQKVKIDTLVYTTTACDSIVFRDVRWLPSDTIRFTQFTCAASQAGLDSLVLKNTKGCDSMIIIESIFIPSDTQSVQLRTCNPTQSGVDSLLLKNVHGCDSLIIRAISFHPIPLQAQIDSISCSGRKDGQVNISNLSDFKDPIIFYLNGQSVASLSGLGPGVHAIYLVDKDGCVSDTLRWTLEDPAPLVTELGPDVEVYAGTKVLLALQHNRPLEQILWQPQHPTGCNPCEDFEITPTQDVWVYSIAIDERGCSSLDSVFIKVLQKSNVFAPNVFSPNGDNINDRFYFMGDEGVQLSFFRIYDRWGEMVFEIENIPVNRSELGWDGNFMGEKMNPGVYTYLAEAILKEGSRVILHGDLTLLR